MSDCPVTLEYEASAVGSWLRDQAGNRWWTVDGDDRLTSELDLPCSGTELGNAIARQGGRVIVFVPPGGTQPAAKPSDLGLLAEDDKGALTFKLAWVSESGPGEPWVLTEDTVARDALPLPTARD